MNVAPEEDLEKCLPRQFRCWFTPKLLHTTTPTADPDTPSSHDRPLTGVAHNFRDHEREASDTSTTMMASDRHALVEILRNCSVVVGLHPDQATEPLVDTALALRKPFAVVPCCVFAAETPGRVLLADGRAAISTESTLYCERDKVVESYEDFVEYLRRKPISESMQGEGIAKKAFLPFHGKNQVIYRH